MTEAGADYAATDPDVFSRGSLSLTYELLRSRDAELALVVRNICHSEPLPKGPNVPQNKNSDYFKVTLDSLQVRAIVENLHVEEQNDPGRMVMAQALMEDWMNLARKMISDLLDEEKPLTN